MTRLVPYLDRIIDLGLIFLLVFTPLAFGSVEEWAQAIAQLVIAVVFAAWVLKITWREPPLGAPGGGRTLLGGRLRLSGLELPALLFVAVIALQLVPLPPAWVEAVSPRTAAIFRDSLPGYTEEESPSFAQLQSWLAGGPRPPAGGVEPLPPDPAPRAALPADVLDVPHPAWRPLSLTPGHTAGALTTLLALLALFMVAYNELPRRGLQMRCLFILAGLMGALAILGILQDLTADQALYWLRIPRYGGYSFGPFVNHNHFAGWMEMALPLTLGLVAALHVRRWAEADPVAHFMEHDGRTVAWMILLGFLSLAGLCAFVLARSRGGYLALASAGLLALVVAMARREVGLRGMGGLVLLVTAGLALAAWLGGHGVVQRLETLAALQEEPSLRFRVQTSFQTVGLARDFPILGTGFGTFEEAYYLYSPGTSYKRLGKAHNDYAQVLAETGLAGGVPVLWALLVIWRRGIAPGLIRMGHGTGWAVRGATVGVLALLGHSLVDFNLQIYSNALLFTFLCALIMQDAAQVRSHAPTL